MSQPRFSVIVPTYDRPAQLRECLAALARVEAPQGGFEICVVNDGGASLSKRVIEETWRAGQASVVRIIEQSNAGPGAARNAGAIAATGEYLAFTDDDCQPSAGWLRAFDHTLRSSPHALAGGRTVNALAQNLCSTASQLLVDSVTSYFDGGSRGLFFASNNIAVQRSDFLEAGGFNARFVQAAGEDREFSDRWWTQRRPSVLSSEALVHHAHAMTFAGYCRQHFTYGRAALRVRQICRERGHPQPLDPRFYLESLRTPYRREPAVRATAVAVLTVVAHAAYFAGMPFERRRATDAV